jgi:ketosteroid isomerase-like protein
VHGCSFVTVAGGRITEAALYYDGAALDAVLARAKENAR